MLLQVKNLAAGYGQTEILRDVSFDIAEGEAICLLGPNGAGKSTLMHSIMGMLRPTSGEIWFDGKRLDGVSTAKIVRQGLILCAERRHLFPTMTVRENLSLGGYRRPLKEISNEIDWAVTLFPRLKERFRAHAGVLSGGEQQMLAIARALVAKPRLLILDEPSLGLAPVVVGQVMKEIATIHKQGVTLCLVEQNALAALQIADRGYVLESGRLVTQGTADELRDNDEVRAVYLGG